MLSIDPATLALLLGAFVTAIGALAAAIVSIIVAIKAPGVTRIIDANNLAAEKLATSAASGADRIANASLRAANTLATVTGAASDQAHIDQSITHDKLDEAKVVADATHVLVNSQKTALETLVASLTKERNAALKELGRNPPEEKPRP